MKQTRSYQSEFWKHGAVFGPESKAFGTWLIAPLYESLHPVRPRECAFWLGGILFGRPSLRCFNADDCQQRPWMLTVEIHSNGDDANTHLRAHTCAHTHTPTHPTHILVSCHGDCKSVIVNSLPHPRRQITSRSISKMKTCGTDIAPNM